MRTSRVSRDAARVFKRASDSLSPPRRTTRASLARFAHTTDSPDGSRAAKEEPMADIEDIIEPPSKRRRKSAKSAVSSIKTELVKEEEEEEETLTTVPSKLPRRPARKPARKTTAIDHTTGTQVVSPPSEWEDVYSAVKKMRTPGGKAYPSAVDTMGCERLADPNASARDQRFHTLVALMLSSQTKDTVNAVAMGRLKTELPAWKAGEAKGLNVENMLAVEDGVLNELIWQVGFHNNKTKYLKQTAKILRDEWNSDIPDTIEGLTSLPGVGPKMAYLCLSAAWDKTEGIGVDVHVHRITNLWGWHKTKNPEETRVSLQSWLPRDKWREINYLLVGFGQTVCLPVGRKCGECDLGLNGLCQSAERKKVIEGRKRVKKEEEEEVLVKDEQGIESVVKIEEEVETTEVVIKEEVVNSDGDNGGGGVKI